MPKKTAAPKRTAKKTARSEKLRAKKSGRSRAKKPLDSQLSTLNSPLSHIAEDFRPLAVPVEVLEVDPQNARRHSVKNVLAITESLKRFGQRRPIVVNRRNQQIEAGHGLLEAAVDILKWTHVAVVWVDDDPHDQTGFAIADNRTAELADWDTDRLLSLLSDLSEEDGLADFGEFSDALLLAELTGSEKAEAPDTSPQLGAMEYRVIVICEDEAHQKTLLTRFEKEGLTCQALIS